MNNKHLVNIPIAYMKENDKKMNEVKQGIYKDIDGVHADLNTVKTDVLEVNAKTSNIGKYLDSIQSEVDNLPKVIEARSKLAEEVSNAYTDGKISNEEAKRITYVLQTIKEAKGYTDVAKIGTEEYINSIKTEVIDYSDTLLHNLEQALGPLAWEDKVELARLGATIIDGGYLKTELIKANSIGAAHINTDELIVGDNITLGPNAIIEWSNLAPETQENLKGEDGIDGAKGDIGPKGDKGDTGAKGATGDRGPKGDKGDKGTDGSYYAPSYLYSNYISNTEIRSPLITGNDGRFADSIYIGQSDGSNNKAGISALGTTDTSVRFWAGNANKLIAPFRVTQGGSVTMTKANIETEASNGLYIKMNGTKVEGGNHTLGSSYVLGTAELTGSLRSGILQLNGYSGASTSTITRTMQMTSNTVMVGGSNLVLGGIDTNGNATVVTRSVMSNSHTKSIPNNIALHVDGGIYAQEGGNVPTFEEGTFTPYFCNQTGDTIYTASFMGRKGRYSRIGNVVYIDIHIIGTGADLANNAVHVGGLPYPHLGTGTFDATYMYVTSSSAIPATSGTLVYSTFGLIVPPYNNIVRLASINNGNDTAIKAKTSSTSFSAGISGFYIIG